VALCAALYARTLDAEFVLDDFDNIVHNPYIRWTGLSLDGLRAAALGPSVRRPVAHASFGLNHALGGYDVTGYHLFNLIVHGLNGVLVYALAFGAYRRLARLPRGSEPRMGPGDEGRAALLAAALFVAHPLQIQAVTYVVQRMTSLATGFYLAALLLWLRAGEASRAGPRAALRGAALASALLALGSKEIAITLPFAVLLTQAWLVVDFDRRWLLRRAPLVAVLLLCAALLAFGFAGSPRYADLDFTAGERLLSQGRVVARYASLIVWPLPSRLNLLHAFEPSRSLLDPPSTLLCWGLLAGAVAWALAMARRRRLASFAVLWFLLHLALESSTLPLRMVFEHRTYLPLVGVAIAASHELVGRLAGHRRAALALAALLVAALSTATALRNETWRRWDRLWQDVIAKSPDDPLARMQHASLLAREARYEEALAELEVSIRLDPRSARPHELRGAVWMARGRPDEALSAFARAEALDPGDASARAHAAEALAGLGRLDEAAERLQAAIARLPDERYVHQLGAIRQRQGRSDEALALHLRAAAMNRRYRPPRIDAGILLADQGRLDEAAALFSEALALGADAELHSHLGNALWEAGRPEEALLHLEAAVRLGPDWLVGVNNLAWMLATAPDPRLRDPERAVALAEDGLRRLEATGAVDAGLLDTLAAAHAAAGRCENAAQVADRALRLARSGGAPELARAIEARRARYAAGAPCVAVDPLEVGRKTDGSP
jgi:tetratricopeptide (TPR) repeat protein